MALRAVKVAAEGGGVAGVEGVEGLLLPTHLSLAPTLLHADQTGSLEPELHNSKLWHTRATMKIVFFTTRFGV